MPKDRDFCTPAPVRPGPSGEAPRWGGMLRGRAARVVTGVLLSCGVALSCSSPPGQDGCRGQLPAFVLSVKFAEGAVPPDTRVTVQYGAGFDVYPPAEGKLNDVLFCAPLSSSPSGHAGAGGQGGAIGGALGGAGGFSGKVGSTAVAALRCELWTDSPVTVRVEAAHYPDLEDELEPRTDECGAVTREVELELSLSETLEGN